MRRFFSNRRLLHFTLILLSYKFLSLLHTNFQGDERYSTNLKQRRYQIVPGHNEALGASQIKQGIAGSPVPFVKGQPKTVILLSYQRSGSTFIGNVVLMNNPDVYYIYEPLDGPYCAMYGTKFGMNIPDDIYNFENGSRRELPAHEVDAMRQTLSNIYNCNTKSSPLQMSLHKYWDFFSKNMEKVKPYATCLEMKKMGYRSVERCRGYINKACGKRFSASNDSSNLCLQRLWFNQSVAKNNLLEQKFAKYQLCLKRVARRLHECIEIPDKTCAENDIRAVKTVRATMDTIKPFFNEFPNFRVIHLIRDPRAAVASKRRRWWAQGSYALDNVTKEAIMYCRGIAQDLRMRSELEQQYPGRIMELVYDDFVRRPEESIRGLYDFLELKLHNTTMEKLKLATTNSTQTAIHWQSQLTYQETKSVEQQCREVYKGVSFSWSL